MAIETRPTEAEPAREVPKPSTEARGGRRQAISVGIAVFTSGAVLLGMEIAASRVVAPFFGNSLFVWGALIGVVLAGLSIGYWVGGVLADRIPALELLLGVMALGAALVLWIPLIDERVLEAVVDWNPGPRANPLVASIVLFGPPSIVLAAVTPIAVRLVTQSLASLGRSAGRLFAVSTAGSIAGTFATAFFLIPELGTNQLLAFSAAALFAAVAGVALVARLPVIMLAGVLATAGAAFAGHSLAPDEGGRLTGAAAGNWSPVYRLRNKLGAPADYGAEGYDVVFQKDTRYHRLAVVDDDNGERFLRFDNSFQSGMFLDRPYETAFEYTDYFDLGLAYKPDARDVAFVGLGGGSALKRLWRDFPRLQLQAIEIDPVVRDVAYRYFGLPRSPRLPVAVEDGRRFLERDERRWDVLAIDAYYADSVPFHLTTREFLELAQSRLAPGGVIVTNFIGSLSGPSSKLFRSVVRTYRTVFPTVLVHPVGIEPGAGEGGDTTIRNLMIIATESPAPSKDFLEKRWAAIRQDVPTAPDLSGAIRGRYDGTIPLDDVPTLTDDYAPTDALLQTG